MKLLKCLFCDGEVDVVGNFDSVVKKIKCIDCGYQNFKDQPKPKEPIIVYKR